MAVKLRYERRTGANDTVDEFFAVADTLEKCVGRFVDLFTEVPRVDFTKPPLDQFMQNLVTLIKDMEQFKRDKIGFHHAGIHRIYVEQVSDAELAEKTAIVKQFAEEQGIEVKDIKGLPDDRMCVCDNCCAEWPESELDDVVDAHERLDPGSVVPAGQCPDCQCLCYLEDGPNEAVVYDAKVSELPWNAELLAEEFRQAIASGSKSHMAQLKASVASVWADEQVDLDLGRGSNATRIYGQIQGIPTDDLGPDDYEMFESRIHDFLDDMDLDIA